MVKSKCGKGRCRNEYKGLLTFAGERATWYEKGMIVEVSGHSGLFRVINTRPIGGIPFVVLRKLGRVEMFFRSLYWRVVTGIGGWA